MIHFLVASGALNELDQWVRIRVEVDGEKWQFEDDLDPLSYAALVDNLPLMKVLLERGFDMNPMLVHAKETPLTRMLKTGNREMVIFLLDNGADIEPYSGETTCGNCALGVAVDFCSKEMIELLIERGVELNEKD
jgi:ankyrin repeat protein